MRLPVLLLCLVTTVPAHAQVDPSLARGMLAVLDFRNKLSDQDRQQLDPGYFADVVRSAALRTLPGLHVITRENLVVLLQSTGRKLEDCEGECEVDTGRRIGADLVISGELLKIGTSYKLNLRLHETRGGQLLNGAVASGKTADELDERTTAAVAELLAPLKSAAPVEKKPAVEDRVKPTPLAQHLPHRSTIADTSPEPVTPTARKVGYGLVAGSALLGAGAAVFALKGKSLNDEIRNGGAAAGPDIQQLANDGSMTNTAAWILTGGGVAALATGIVLVVLNPAEPAQHASVAIGPSGFLVAGRF